MTITLDDSHLDQIAEKIAARNNVAGTRRLLNVPQTAEYLGITENAVRALRRKGKIHPVESFGRLLFDVRALDRMIDGERAA